MRMSMPCYLRVRGLYERINDEIKKQNKTKIEIAKNCGFARGVIINEDCNISLPNFAKLCKELNVSADYLLFGK